MARSAEKAMTALARWRAVFVDKVQDVKRRPYLATECDSLRDCLRHRKQILAEVSRKVSQVQNAGLGEFKLRDLNDEINKLLREKGHWEDRIKALGGPDYRRTGPRMFDNEGREAPGGSRGYRYFGAARDLPGVRELFEADPTPPPRKSRAELLKFVDVDYYGYRDEDDDVVLVQELAREKEYVRQCRDEWRRKRDEGVRAAVAAKGDEEEEDIYAVANNPADDEMERMYDILDSETSKDTVGDSRESKKRSGSAAQILLENDGADGGDLALLAAKRRCFVSHVPVPSQAEVEAALVERKKQQLLERYASDDLIQEAAATRRMLGLDSSAAVGNEVEEEEEEEEEEEDKVVAIKTHAILAASPAEDGTKPERDSSAIKDHETPEDSTKPVNDSAAVEDHDTREDGTSVCCKSVT